MPATSAPAGWKPALRASAGTSTRRNTADDRSFCKGFRARCGVCAPADSLLRTRFLLRVFQFFRDGRAARQKHWQPWTYVIIENKNLQFSPKLAMVAVMTSSRKND